MEKSEESGTRKMEKYKRPKDLKGHTPRGDTGCGHIYVTVNHSPEGRVVEMFTTVGKTGQCTRAQMEALTRSITLGLKYGIPIEEYIKQFKGIRCPTPITIEGQEILSCADAMARILQEEIDGQDKKQEGSRTPEAS